MTLRDSAQHTTSPPQTGGLFHAHNVTGARRASRSLATAERQLAALQAVAGSKLIAKALYGDVEGFADFCTDYGPGASSAIADMLERKRDVFRRNGYFRCWGQIRHAIDNTRECRQCHATKPDDAFKVGIRPGLKTNLCCECDRRYYQVRRKANRERYRELERRRHQAHLDKRRAAARTRAASPAGRESNRLAVQRYQERFPDRRAARRLVQIAVMRGDLVRPDCCQAKGCSQPAKHGHHSDYARPLDVDWLCHHCHESVHHNGRLELKPGGKRKFARAPKPTKPPAQISRTVKRGRRPTEMEARAA